MGSTLNCTDLHLALSLFSRIQVNFPKQKKTYCKRCKKHTLQSITWQKKGGKASLVAQGTYSFIIPRPYTDSADIVASRLLLCL